MTAGFHGEHPTADQIDGLVDHLLGRADAPSDRQVQPVREHCAACAACSEKLGRLRRVRDRLNDFAAHELVIPNGLSNRVVSTLQIHSQMPAGTHHFPTAAATAVTQSIPIIRQVGNDDITPLSADPIVLRPHHESTRRAPIWAAVAAVAVVAVGLGFVGTKMLRRDAATGTDGLASAGQAEPIQQQPIDTAAARKVMRQSGTAYTEDRLQSQVATLLAAVGAEPSSKHVGVAKAALPGPTAVAASAGSLSDEERFADCLRALNLGADQLVAFDIAQWHGQKAAVAVSNSGEDRNVWVVGNECGRESDDLLHWALLTP